MDKSEYKARMKERKEKVREEKISESDKVEKGHEVIIEIIKELEEGFNISIDPPSRDSFQNFKEIQGFIRELSTSSKIRDNIDPSKFHVRRRFDQLYSEASKDLERIDSGKLREINTENLIDYLEYAGDKLDLSENDVGAYIFAEKDSIPAVHLPPKSWFLIGLNGGGTKKIKGTKMRFEAQDINKGLPSIEDSSLDVVLIKGPGPAEKSTLENSFRVARKKVKEDGIILSDQKVNMKGFQAVGDINPRPECFNVTGKPIKDPYTGYTPMGLENPLIVYKTKN